MFPCSFAWFLFWLLLFTNNVSGKYKTYPPCGSLQTNWTSTNRNRNSKNKNKNYTSNGNGIAPYAEHIAKTSDTSVLVGANGFLRRFRVGVGMSCDTLDCIALPAVL